MDNKRQTWAEIDLTAVRNNLRRVKEAVNSNTKVMAVVKADAYGHGMLPIAKLCLEESVDYLGVATLDEAERLRGAGINIPILVMGYVPHQYLEEFIKNDISATVYDYAYAAELSKLALSMGKKAAVHIKIDTGMGRIGFMAGTDAINSIEKIARLPGIDIQGIFSHFAEADAESSDYTCKQLQVFKKVSEEIKKRGIEIPIRHCANSAAIFKYPEAHLDMVRAGDVIYGLYPSPGMKVQDLGIIPAMTLKSRISMVKYLDAGCSISYGRTYICDKKTRVATVPIGYADGYSRLFSNQAWSMIKGHRAAGIGAVCMDQCMFDITGRDDIKEGDEVILFGKDQDGITADDLARVANTINYEIVCWVSSRVPRIYV